MTLTVHTISSISIKIFPQDFWRIMNFKCDFDRERIAIQRVQLFVLTIALGLGWAMNYFVDGPDLVQRLSFQTNDPSWVPDTFNQLPIIGEHYFGDLQLLIAWGENQDPYSVLIPAQHLPVAQGLLRVLSLLPMNLVFVGYLTSSLLMLWYAAKNLVSVASNNTRRLDFLDFGLFILLTVPVLVDLDRGNVNSICISCTVIYLSMIQSGKPVKGLLFLLIGCSFKPYLALFLFCSPMRFVSRRWISVLTAFAMLNVIGFKLFAGAFWNGFIDWLNAFIRYGSSDGASYMMISGSLTGSLSRWIELLIGHSDTVNYLQSNIAIVRYVSGIAVLIGFLLWYKATLPWWIRTGAILSIITVAQPGSAQYQWTWVGFVLLASLYTDPSKSSHPLARSPSARKILYVVFLLAAMPTWIEYSVDQVDRFFPQYLFLSPLIILLGIVLLGYRTRSVGVTSDAVKIEKR